MFFWVILSVYIYIYRERERERERKRERKRERATYIDWFILSKAWPSANEKDLTHII